MDAPEGSYILKIDGVELKSPAVPDALLQNKTAGTVTLTLLKLGYVVTLWNSHSIVWLRQRVFAPQQNQSTDK